MCGDDAAADHLAVIQAWGGCDWTPTPYIHITTARLLQPLSCPFLVDLPA
ncbi:MAG: hypothetical protein P8K80_06145 [Phycisphaerales bacterium]|nr:hypothetical protein [Phycisphaerales bacterium]